MPTEAELDEAINDLKSEIGLATQRVLDAIAKCEANHPDLSDELDDIKNATQALKAIAPTPPEKP